MLHSCSLPLSGSLLLPCAICLPVCFVLLFTFPLLTGSFHNHFPFQFLLLALYRSCASP
eukprot:TRINITY_DN4764_c0_g1_i1.p3 TRINITY_DN4764_c0_g1~~TRINITY_DN4764_c0_g1_i1.p3  ORF type:complete len:59 (-),score=9.84 TRINITY_DN4764_c0_g1_i1:43-219(-)